MLCGIGNENFKHGIEIITIADYFSLGNRVHSYLSIAPTVALFDSDLLVALKDHLISVKLAHWDTDIRLEIVVVYVLYMYCIVVCCAVMSYGVMYCIVVSCAVMSYGMMRCFILCPRLYNISFHFFNFSVLTLFINFTVRSLDSFRNEIFFNFLFQHSKFLCLFIFVSY